MRVSVKRTRIISFVRPSAFPPVGQLLWTTMMDVARSAMAKNTGPVVLGRNATEPDNRRANSASEI